MTKQNKVSHHQSKLLFLSIYWSSSSRAWNLETKVEAGQSEQFREAEYVQAFLPTWTSAADFVWKPFNYSTQIYSQGRILAQGEYKFVGRWFTFSFTSWSGWWMLWLKVSRRWRADSIRLKSNTITHHPTYPDQHARFHTTIFQRGPSGLARGWRNKGFYSDRNRTVLLPLEKQRDFLVYLKIGNAVSAHHIPTCD